MTRAAVAAAAAAVGFLMVLYYSYRFRGKLCHCVMAVCKTVARCSEARQCQNRGANRKGEIKDPKRL